MVVLVETEIILLTNRLLVNLNAELSVFAELYAIFDALDHFFEAGLGVGRG